MFHSSRASSAARSGPLVLALLLSVGVGGCDEVGPCYLVEGQVLLSGKPIKGMTGSVLFVPDSARGNLSPFRAGGQLDAEGRYRLSTSGRSGAPAGWYKVVVTAVPPGTGDREVVKRPVINLRYTAAKTTPLTIAVVASAPAGGYDLKVTRN